MATFTYPGVYIQELTSAVHTITGVATSIAAFVGWAPQGPVTEATLVESWPEYEALFGGLDMRSYLGYAVNHFFGNGGQQAYIVRLTWDGSLPAAPGTTPAVAQTATAVWQKFGVATIQATLGSVSGSAQLAVGANFSSLNVSPAIGSVAVGAKLQLTAVGVLPDGTTVPLSPPSSAATWAPDPASPAATIVAGTGVVTGVAVGSADFNATVSGVSSVAAVIAVTAAAATPALTAIVISGPNSIPVGKSTQLTAVATFSDGSTADITAQATTTWATTSVAAVTVVTGMITGVAAGSSIISATVGSVTQNFLVNVTTPGVTLASIAVTPSPVSVPLGPQQFKAVGIYSDGSQTDLTNVATWTFTGAGGTMSATKPGLLNATAAAVGDTLTAAWQGVTSTPATPVTIVGKQLVSIAVTSPSQAILLGVTSNFTATGTYSDNSTQDLTSTATWTSSAPSLATVSTTGVATATSGASTLTLFANNPGNWGNNLRVSVTVQPPPNDTRFGILVQQVDSNGRVQTLESFSNLSTTATDPLFAVKVIDSDSNYISFIDPTTGNPVAPTGTPAATNPANPLALSGGADGGVLVPASDGNFELMLLNNPNGAFLLSRISIFNLLCVPAETDAPTIQALQNFCNTERAFYIVDPPQIATAANLTNTGPVGSTSGSLTGVWSDHSAYYFPWVEAPDPLFGNRTALFPPCGMIAGVYATTDATRGVWKAPAGIDASLSGLSGLQYTLTDLENGDLNTQAINCLREFRVYGDVVWGARTLQGNDQAGSQWKYVPIRRFALFLETSLIEGLQWVVFEPNDDTLWGQIRLNVSTFMQTLFLQGAFQGTTPPQAYFVKCDADNNPQSKIDQGIVTVLVGFAPLYPAEFVLIQIEQLAGQSS
jgi:phage tail sheath protein FI